MVEDYEAEDLEKLLSKIVDGLGFRSIGQRIDIYRYCDKCNESTLRAHARKPEL
jgi:Fe2+ or Zn2+ uptake regulation protein